jgi:squalene-hopene/tetraprenyl-beta-curcumene cyclase
LNASARDAVSQSFSARLRERREARVAAEADGALDGILERARTALIGLQHQTGYWLFELEADCTIPAEYIMMMHFLDELDEPLQAKIAVYLRARQAGHGGWPLYHNGEFNISASVKAYFALKLAGDSPDASHMMRARQAILQHGGAAQCNVFTRIALAMFGQVPWRAVPYIPVEIMLLPKWFPFHLDKVSYWSRTVMVPLLILCSQRARARNPRDVHLRELFRTPPEKERHYFHLPPDRAGLLARYFLVLDHVVRHFDWLIPKSMRARATRRAEAWFLERLNGEDGLGAIFPAMVNALEAMVLRGVAADDPRRVTAKRALQKLLVVGEDSAYCQPCVSPIWDSALAALAMQAEGDAASRAAAERALDWLLPLQLLDDPGDWRVQRPKLPGGGWAFQFANGHYPDLDDTAVIAWAMCHASDPSRYTHALNRALDWLVGMQSRNGGFAAFDAENTHYHLNYIPFADHGALLDPPTSDVSARVVTALAVARRPQDRPAMTRAIAYLRNEQCADGSWFGRWGTNYIYGTWSVLIAFAHAGIGPDDESVQRAVGWFEARQNLDGGWGESNDSYARPPKPGEPTPSNPYQTAWAVLALLAAGAGRSDAVRSGVAYLRRTQQADGLWSDPTFTAPGFPRVFYLRYHGYCAYFPLWALAAYRNFTASGAGY